MSRTAAAALVLLVVACSTDKIDVAPSSNAADQNRGQMLAALAELRAARHTPAAYRKYADRLLALRIGMDETVAEETELLTVTEASIVMQKAVAGGMPNELMALTLWPLGLAPTIAADVPGEPTADEWASWVPRPGEDAGAYVERLCGGVLAVECKGVVPEGQLSIVEGLVVQRYTKRSRRAVSTCLTCSEPGWSNAVAAWEERARELTTRETATRERYNPSRWPVAGAGAVEVPSELPVVELLASDRAERVRYALDEAQAHGAAQIALIAREPLYPYRRRAYVMASADRLPVRPGEPVQVLARALDAAAKLRQERGAKGKRP